jgi:hypothetical protein
MQSIEDVLALYRSPEPELVPGQLTPEFQAILEQGCVDRREFDFNLANGDFAKAFESQAESTSLHKSADFVEADEVLRDFQTHHDKRTLAEQLAPLVEKACLRLSKEHGELLRKAHAVLDLSVLSFLLGKAFA